MLHFLKTFDAPRTALAACLIVGTFLLNGCGDKTPASAAKTADKATPAKGEDHAKDGKGHEAEGGIKLTVEEVKLAGMRVEPVQVQEVADQLVVTATIQANQDRLARLAPRVPGRIVKVNANLGDRVTVGQVLASLDSIEVGEARSAHVQAETEAQVAKASFERAERLQAEQIVSQKDFLRARAEHDKARAALRAAAGKLQMLGVGTKHDSVSTYPLTAPFAGTVIEKKAVLGELAQPDKSLFAIADLSLLWIEANLSEKDLGRIKIGDSALITVAAYPNERIPGKLTYIGSMLDGRGAPRAQRARPCGDRSRARARPRERAALPRATCCHCAPRCRGRARSRALCRARA